MEKAPHSIHPDTRIGPVVLAVPDIGRSQQFYQELIGLATLHKGDGWVHLGPPEGETLLVLEEQPGVQPEPYSTGLYHLAIRVPSRLDLACSLHRLLGVGWPPQGFADHGVSEAIYLVDPDGNGIEIYRDYPRSEWPSQGGRLTMTSDPLDVSSLLGEIDQGNGLSTSMPAKTTIGHVHLRVANIPAAEEFYTLGLGFDLVLRYGPSAGFVSAGGYHHHIGYNTWNSAGAAPATDGASGLRYFTIYLPDKTALNSLVEHLGAAGIPVEKRSSGFFVRDPSQNGILLAQEPVPNRSGT